MRVFSSNGTSSSDSMERAPCQPLSNWGTQMWSFWKVSQGLTNFIAIPSAYGYRASSVHCSLGPPCAGTHHTSRSGIYSGGFPFSQFKPSHLFSRKWSWPKLRYAQHTSPSNDKAWCMARRKCPCMNSEADKKSIASLTCSLVCLAAGGSSLRPNYVYAPLARPTRKREKVSRSGRKVRH
jgi:hypothetical protein